MGGEISLERLLMHLRAVVVSPGYFVRESAREDITALEQLLHQAEGMFIKLFVVDFKTAQKKKFISGYLERVIIPDSLPIVHPYLTTLSHEEQSEILKAYRILFIIRITDEPYKISVSINLFQMVTVFCTDDEVYEDSSLNILIFRKATEQEKELFLRNGKGKKSPAIPSVPTELSEPCAVSA